MKSKTSNSMRIVIAFLCLVSLVSCDTIKKRTKLVEELSKRFQENYTDFEMVRSYLFNDESYFGFSFDYKDDRIKLKQGDNTIRLDSIGEIKKDTVVYNILSFMKEEGIRDISGNKEWIKVSFEEQKHPCFGFWYRKDFNPNDEMTKQKINNFKNTETKNWVFVLKDKWFIKGSPVFN